MEIHRECWVLSSDLPSATCACNLPFLLRSGPASTSLGPRLPANSFYALLATVTVLQVLIMVFLAVIMASSFHIHSLWVFLLAPFTRPSSRILASAHQAHWSPDPCRAAPLHSQSTESYTLAALLPYCPSPLGPGPLQGSSTYRPLGFSPPGLQHL